MATQSSSHSWIKEISEALCNPSKMCAFFAWALWLLARGVFRVLVTLIVSLFCNWTIGPFLVFIIFVSTVMYSVHQSLFYAPMSDFAIIVACCGGSTIYLHNSSDVLDSLISSTLVLLEVIDPNCQVQFLSLPDILLHHTAYFWCPFVGFLQSFPGWSHIPCVQK